MNNEKARDFFSAYYEGSIDNGLRQALEQKMGTDPRLRQEFDSFVATMKQLETLRDEQIEPPIYLSDRIASRLEQAQEQKKLGVPSWLGYLRGFAFAGLAAAAIFGAVITLKPFGGDSSQASIASMSPRVLNVSASADGITQIGIVGQVGPTEAQLFSDQTGKSLGDVTASEKPVALTNPGARATIFRAEMKGEDSSILIVVPGQSPVRTQRGEGTLKDFCRALADYYRTPIVLKSKATERTVTWVFDAPKAFAAAQDNLGSQGKVLDKQNLLEILD